MPQARSELTRFGLPLWAATFVALVCFALVGLSAWHQWLARQNDLRSAEVDMANLARSLTQHADDTFDLVDTVVTSLANRIETDGIQTDTIKRIHQLLQLPRNSSRIRSIFVCDETGRVIATTERLDAAGANDFNREYFQHHVALPSRETYIGPPVTSGPESEWILTVSRRFDHQDGSFAGVVVATIDIDYFGNYYQQFDVGEGGAISLFSSGGTLLARSKNADALVGHNLSAAPIFRAHNSGMPEGLLHFRSSLDGIERLSSFTESKRYPIAVVVRRAKDEILASWWRETTMQIFFVSCLAALFALMGTHLTRRLIERQRMATALAAKESDFRLLAEHSSDVVMRIGVDEKIVYVSPSCAQILGWSADRLQGTRALAGVRKDDRSQVRQLVDALKRGEMTEARMIYRNRHCTKGEIWLETALQITRNAQTGAIDGVVAICRDVTQHKDTERKLNTLARSDALTGLANRRQFDEVLAQEWARAKRDNTELGLLLIDVDHFKRYNDHYGHQAGDDCLRTVALVIANQAQPPADLAARYGGEEFALLLPNTDKDGCWRIADNIRNMLYEISIDHAGNDPFGRVTISVGGAAIRPADVTTNAGAFVESVDAALYLAKNSGRNAVRIAGQTIITLDTTIARRRQGNAA